jgi:hypothetical protein
MAGFGRGYGDGRMKDEQKLEEIKAMLDEAYADWKRFERVRDAASDMLAALKVVAGSDNWRCFVDEEWDIVNAAIAKAEGRS